jgi:hypothetical protein
MNSDLRDLKDSGISSFRESILKCTLLPSSKNREFKKLVNEMEESVEMNESGVLLRLGERMNKFKSERVFEKEEKVGRFKSVGKDSGGMDSISEREISKVCGSVLLAANHKRINRDADEKNNSDHMTSQKRSSRPDVSWKQQECASIHPSFSSLHLKQINPLNNPPSHFQTSKQASSNPLIPKPQIKIKSGLQHHFVRKPGFSANQNLNPNIQLHITHSPNNITNQNPLKTILSHNNSKSLSTSFIQNSTNPTHLLYTKNPNPNSNRLRTSFSQNRILKPSFDSVKANKKTNNLIGINCKNVISKKKDKKRFDKELNKCNFGLFENGYVERYSGFKTKSYDSIMDLGALERQVEALNRELVHQQRKQNNLLSLKKSIQSHILNISLP